jgi:hypothetical protein
LPTLTEVVPGEAAETCGEDARAPAADARMPAADAAAESEQSALERRVLAAVQQRVDLVLEYRLRDVLGPALARAADALIREMHFELSATLRDVVAQAVAQELERHHDRPG